MRPRSELKSPLSVDELAALADETARDLMALGCTAVVVTVMGDPVDGEAQWRIRHFGQRAWMTSLARSVVMYLVDWLVLNPPVLAATTDTDGGIS